MINTYTEDEMTVRLVDFGSAQEKLSDQKLKNNFNEESVNFWAPEVINQEDHMDTKLDVWSVTVVIFMMLSYDFPFWGRDFESTKKKILKGEIEFRSEHWRTRDWLALDFIK